jgi:beta-glucosidase
MIKKILLASVFSLLFMSFYQLKAQEKGAPQYLNTNLSTEQRVDDLVSKLTLDQKIKLMMNRGTAIESNGLQIPAYNWWNECLHGVARAGKATVFPQAIGLAATWDKSLMFNVGNAISDEARAKHEYFNARDQRGIYMGLNFWTPNINIFRDPRWGRGMETYGEDPYLTGEMAVSFIKGLQGDDPKYLKTIATIKHFVAHSGPEEGRSGFNADVSRSDLLMTYAPAFKNAVQNSGVYSLMCAYNAFNGEPCCSNHYLMNDLLREQWGFKGFVVTDCGAVSNIYRKGAHEKVATAEEASAWAIKSGVDLECGSAFISLNIAIEKKLITERELDNAVKRLFTARFKLGSFDDPKEVAYTQIPYSVVESKEHVQLSLEAAQKSIVLLKNNNLLPLKKSVKKIAVIGPNANDSEALLANYHGFPSKIVTPLEAIKNKLPNSEIFYAQGAPLVEGLSSVHLITSDFLFTDQSATKNGLKADYYDNEQANGKPLYSQVDSQIDFNWTNDPPSSKLAPFSFAVNWNGFIKAPLSGKYVLDVYGCSDYELFIDGVSLFKYSSSDGPEHRGQEIEFEKDKTYKIEIKFANRGANAMIKLNWQLPNVDLLSEALQKAREADVVVMCMGLSPRIEGESMVIKADGFNGGDRTKIALPKIQQDLIKEIVALGKPVVLILVNGSAVAINWENENIPAIIESWYGGQEAGTAIADVLFGDYNPAGRLPVTFYKSENDIPDFDNYDMKGIWFWIELH